MRKKLAEKEALEEAKKAITWGSQIRSYVLDDSRVKDLRTNIETRNPQAVLDGDLDLFIKQSFVQFYTTSNEVNACFYFFVRI